MARCDSLAFHYSFSVLIVFMSLLLCSAIEEDRKVHIVYMGSLPKENYLPSSHHISLLQEVVEDSGGKDYLIRSYKKSFNGFAAKLSDKEQQRLAGMEGVVSVFPSKTLEMHTTRSWDFMGFTENVKRNPTIESNVIIGVFDTGIWPESKSFSDKGLNSPPKKWKGVCNGGKNFTCNNKVIGARYYSSRSDDMSARDMMGHGSHTASIAAGSKVKDVSFYGLAQGDARGGVPSARIAAYAVCSINTGCQEEDILAAFDDAIADGVDIITLSIGRDHAVEIYRDAIAIGSFHAMEKGILTSNSAGNNGFMSGTVSSVAPWMLTVAASSTDRRIIGKLVLGNGRTIMGNTVNSFMSTGKTPLINGEENKHLLCAWYKKTGSAKGKIVLCFDIDGGEEAYKDGALGSILRTEEFDSDSYPVVPFSAIILKENDHGLVMSYINSTKNPEANILRSEVIEDLNAPLVASFSSLGPNTVIPEILKPDITAPGVGILAAYSPASSPSRSSYDKRSVNYNILSGTSMACPHAAGAAAYVKTLHPDWSPSAIKSALMTTAWLMNNTKNRYGEFGYGAGHIDPVKAGDPGLVYEAFKKDYINMLCSIGYDADRLRHISGDNSSCPKNITSAKDLNYPSMAANVGANKIFKIEFRRTVTNVGPENSIYKAQVASNDVITIRVVPRTLIFESLNEKKSFVLSVVGELPEESMVSSQLVWSDGIHSVRTPVVVYNTLLAPSI